jgi:fibro-slime domain-containing protein
MRRVLASMVVGLAMTALMALGASPALALSFEGHYYTLSSTHVDTLLGNDGGIVSGLVNAALSGTAGTSSSAPVYSGLVPPLSGLITDTIGGAIQWWTAHSAVLGNVAPDTTVNAGSSVRSDAVTAGVLGGGAFATSFFSGAAGCAGTNNSCGYRAVHWIGAFSVVGAPVTISLTADDDAWLFLNGSLALDNGGVKASSPATTTPGSLGVGDYILDLFFADRHQMQAGITFSCGGAGTCVDLAVVDLEPGVDLDPIPEPATLLLFGTTLAGLGAVLRWRMKGQKAPEV